MVMRVVKIRVPEPKDLIPEEFRKHMVNAAKEVLLAFRSLVDLKIKKLEKLETMKEGVKKIEVE